MTGRRLRAWGSRFMVGISTGEDAYEVQDVAGAWLPESVALAELAQVEAGNITPDDAARILVKGSEVAARALLSSFVLDLVLLEDPHFLKRSGEIVFFKAQAVRWMLRQECVSENLLLSLAQTVGGELRGYVGKRWALPLASYRNQENRRRSGRNQALWLGEGNYLADCMARGYQRLGLFG